MNKQIEEKKKDIKTLVWENLQLVCLFCTILGQTIIGGWYLVAQFIWLGANALALTRNFVLHRPMADKVKDAGLTALTVGLIILRITGIY